MSGSIRLGAMYIRGIWREVRLHALPQWCGFMVRSWKEWVHLCMETRAHSTSSPFLSNPSLFSSHCPFYPLPCPLLSSFPSFHLSFSLPTPLPSPSFLPPSSPDVPPFVISSHLQIIPPLYPPPPSPHNCSNGLQVLRAVASPTQSGTGMHIVLRYKWPLSTECGSFNTNLDMNGPIRLITRQEWC